MAEEEAEVRGAAMAAIAEIEQHEVSQAEESKASPEHSIPAMHDALLETCPCCGWDANNKNMPVPGEDDRQEYVRCIMGKRKFSKTYSLFEGEVTINFQMLTALESNFMSEALATVKISTDPFETTTKALRIKLLFYLRQFNKDKFKAPTKGTVEEGPTPDQYEYWDALYYERFGESGEDVPVLLTRVLMEYLRLIEMLPSAGLDQNFWKGAGLA